MVVGASIRLYMLIEIVDYYGVGMARYRLYFANSGSQSLMAITFSSFQCYSNGILIVSLFEPMYFMGPVGLVTILVSKMDS